MTRQSQNTDQEQLLKTITLLLQKAHISYMVTGALSVIFYGRPRASHDIDLVIEAKKDKVANITKALASLSDEFLIDVGHVKDAIEQNLHGFNILHLQTMLKLDFWLLKDNSFDKSRFRRRKIVKIFGQQMTFSSPEDTILIKLLWYKESNIEKHLVDAAFVYQIQNESLDKEYLVRWSKKQKTENLLEEIKKIDLEKFY